MNPTNLNSTLWRSVRGPVLMIVAGTLFVIDHAESLKFSRTWPLLLVTYGIFKLLERQAAASEPAPAMPSGAYGQGGYTQGSYAQGAYNAGAYNPTGSGPSWWGNQANNAATAPGATSPTTPPAPPVSSSGSTIDPPPAV